MRLVAILATDAKGVRVQCAGCHAMLPLFGAVADLDGKAFVYYHEACAPQEAK